jgi:hypothetical protein
VNFSVRRYSQYISGVWFTRGLKDISDLNITDKEKMIQKFSIECLEEDLIIEVTGDTRIQCYFTAVVWAIRL